MKPKSKRRWVGPLLVYAQLGLVLLVILLPIAWMFLAAFRDNVDITAYPPKLFAPLTLDNYIALVEKNNLGRFALNSVIIVAGSTLVGLLLGVPAAYAAARFNMQRWAFLTLLARMAPGILFLIPWYMVVIGLQATDNLLVLILTHTVITMPIIVWLMISFFEELPTEIEESAMMDGCSAFQVLRVIAVPLAAPGIAVSAILAFIFSWNYFLFALVLGGNKSNPLTVAAFQFIGAASINWGGLMAAATVISAVPLILTLFVQRWLVRGLTAGAVKG